MNENKVITNTENENEETAPVYSSKFTMSKELFYDFFLVSFHGTKKRFLAFLCATIVLIISYILLESYGMVSISLLVSFLMTLVYFKTKKAMKIGYERNVISSGKVSTHIYELFEDKIVTNFDGLKREYFYNQITKFYETKSFILLHLQHGLYITINKDTLSGNVDEVKAYLLQKCTFVKKKKFIKCSNDKKWTLAYLITLISVSVFGTLFALLLLFQTLS